MAKERTVDHASSDQDSFQSPHACCLKAMDCKKNHDGSSPYVGDEKEWEQVQCPVCLEHPHNAVLLLCSSKDKGCRPFICDTSYRHSNCFDHFKKSFPQSSAGLQTGNEDPKPELICPLCRGLVTGWVVVEPARKYMDSKTRSCSLETCSFSGNYARLRKHARTEHPYKRPSEVSPTRQSSWLNMERQRELEDAYAYDSDFGLDPDGFPDPDVFPEFDPDWEWLEYENWLDFFDGSFDAVGDILHSPSSPSFRTTSSWGTFDWSSSSSSGSEEMFFGINDVRRRDYGDRGNRSNSRSGYERENNESTTISRSRINRDGESSRFGNHQRESSRRRRRSNLSNRSPRSDYYREDGRRSSREESRRSNNSRSNYHGDNARSSTRGVGSSREAASERSRRRRSRDRSSSRYYNSR